MADGLSGREAGIKRRSFLVELTMRLVKEKPLGMVTGVITLLLFLVAVFADLLAPYGMNEMTGRRLLSPSASFWMGTDQLGRDLLSRIIYGARISLTVGLVGSMLATSISVLIGIVSGYSGGKFDLIMQRFVDSWLCFPGLVVLMVLISMMDHGMWQIIIAVGILWGIGGSRIIRGAAMSIKENTYIEAAKAIGCSKNRILIRHILPNIMASAIVLFTTNMPGMIIAEASLSFLGFGVPPPTPTWGSMLSGSVRRYMFLNPWMVIWPGLALTIVVVSINLFGDALRDILDPRLKGRGGRYKAAVKRN